MRPQSIWFARLAILFALMPAALSAQGKSIPSEAEMRSEVPELVEFHEVIYRIWHDAWPSKNIAMLRQLTPTVEEKSTLLCAAKLPGILREKQSTWTIAVDSLKSIVGRYAEASQKNDSLGLLASSEQLHRQFEVMVRIIRPAFKELDEFHSVLYRLYHYYKPQKDLEKAKLAVTELRERLKSLERSVLPERFNLKQDAFRESVRKLGEAVSLLNDALPMNDWSLVDKRIDAVHTGYEDVNRLFN